MNVVTILDISIHDSGITLLYLCLLYFLSRKIHSSLYRVPVQLLLDLFLAFDLVNTIINNEMFWASFSDCLLLLYKNTMHYCMLAIYLKVLQNSLIYSGSCDSFLCSTYIIRPSAKDDYFICYSLTLVTFIL